MEKATLEALIARKMQSRNEKMMTKEVEIPSLNMTITVVKQPLSRILRLIDDVGQDDSVSGKFEMYKQLIYKSVPLFQDPKLQEVYECVEPFDIVNLVLEDNIQAIGQLGDEICSMYGLGQDKIIADLKN